ncbi:MAG: efflux RND transporter periplasmic adaptor subunit [Hyphomicrobiaceae bacterium]
MASYSLRQLLIAGVAATAVFAAVVWWFVVSRPLVIAVKPTRGDAAEVVYATGVVEPQQWAKVSSLQRKRILEHCDCEGKAVKRGDVLARLEDGAERALLRELEARRERIQEEAQRLEGLVERNVTTRVTYDEKLTQLREQDARIAAQKDRINDLVLRAPMDGVVLRRDGEVGEIAGTNAADILFWIGQPKPLRVVAEVNEEDIIKTRLGMKVLLRHEGLPGEPLPATLSEITPKGDPSTKTFRVYFALPDDTPLRIGMSVEANIIVREVKGALLVPIEAVVNGNVFEIRDGRVHRIAIKAGIRGARMVEILAGLGLDQTIASPPGPTLRDGARVRVQSASPAP